MRLFTFAFLLLISFSSLAQPCGGPGRTADASIAVCGTLVFPQANVPTCTGPNLPSAGCIDPVTSSNSVWYKFHCYQTGTLGFLIVPASPADDYDWQLMDVTGRPVSDVYTTNLAISVNLSATTGNTGCTPTGTGSLNCAGNTPVFNRMPTLTAGNDYLLMVTNWSNSGLGYNLTFTGGTTVLTNNLAPVVGSAGIVGCDASKVKVNFSEDMLCSSLTANGSEFTITNGTHVITGVTSLCSGTSSTFTSATLSLQTPLPAGNYNLIVNNGSDLNTVLDVCQNPLTAGTSIPFTVPVQAALTMSNISFNGCAPTIIKVAMNKPVLCNSISANGSEFSITPGTHAITSVQSACNTGSTYTDTIKLVLQNPLPFGTYQVTINNGSDGNTLTDTCGISIAAASVLPFTINQLTTAPVIQSVIFDDCKPNRVTVKFNKNLACNSLTANGSEFSVTPGAFTVLGIIGNCNASGYTNQVVLNLSGNLPAGNFSVKIGNGTDGNTLSDSCFSFMPINAAQAFTATQAPAPRYDSMQYNKCGPSTIKVFYSKPIRCTSVNPNGSEFSITGPSAVSIASVTTDATCSNGYTKWILLQLTQPISSFGNYVLHNNAGTDGNSVQDTCFALQNTTETIGFNVLGRPSSVFTDLVAFGCVSDTIRLSHPGGNGINSWNWTFSDGTTGSGQTISHTFPVSTVTATVKLIVSNGICTDTLQRSYPLNNAIRSDFKTDKDTTCVGANIVFTNQSTGLNLQHKWLFGDNTQFTGLTPPAHSYSVDGDYLIKLIITNNHGCTDTARKNINVAAKPQVSFTGLNAQYCTGDNVTLVSNLLGSISQYTWNTGNGTSVSDQPTITYPYTAPGDFTVTLDATSSYCGTIQSQGLTKVYLVPSFELGEQKILCPGLTTQLGIANVTGYLYNWNSGGTTSTIITGPESYTYKLVVDNNGCKAEDEVFIKVLSNCLIKVPNAFTPNEDGVNDRLKAINADLATTFSLKVYNRFGELVYSSINPVEGWNGRHKGQPAEAGTYVWQLNYVDPISRKVVYEKGTTILIR